MSLIDRYTGKKYKTWICERCGREMCNDDHYVDGHCVCEDCGFEYRNPATMAKFASEYPGSWYTFMTKEILGEGDMYWSEISERAIDYYEIEGHDYGNWFINEYKI